jgi:hypothetical protein
MDKVYEIKSKIPSVPYLKNKRDRYTTNVFIMKKKYLLILVTENQLRN